MYLIGAWWERFCPQSNSINKLSPPLFMVLGKREHLSLFPLGMIMCTCLLSMKRKIGSGFYRNRHGQSWVLLWFCNR
ncbi:hypothetical protein ACSBR1_029026 [Camellia fascicularis]